MSINFKSFLKGRFSQLFVRLGAIIYFINAFAIIFLLLQVSFECISRYLYRNDKLCQRIADEFPIGGNGMLTREFEGTLYVSYAKCARSSIKHYRTLEARPFRSNRYY